jgi:hypothetical protein
MFYSLRLKALDLIPITQMHILQDNISFNLLTGINACIKTLMFICINYPYTTSHAKSVLGTKWNIYLVIYTSFSSTVSLHEVSITVASF